MTINKCKFEIIKGRDTLKKSVTTYTIFIIAENYFMLKKNKCKAKQHPQVKKGFAKGHDKCL